MSSVADILQALAENAGQAQLRKGAIYGGLVSTAAQLPAQISADKEHDAAVKMANARTQQQMALEQSRAAREDQLARHQDTADAQAAQTQQHLGAIIGAGFSADPKTFDQGAAVSKAQELGRPDLIPTVAAVHEKFQPKLTEHDPTKALRNETGGIVVPAVPKVDPVTTAGLDARQQFLLSKQKSGVPMTTTETNDIAAYNERKAGDKMEEPLTVKTMVNGKPVERVITRAQALKEGSFPSQPAASTIINPANMPSGDALDMAAKRYLAMGDLPPMGMGQAGVAARIAVMNAAAKIDPSASLAANKATFGADSKNLANLQRMEGTLSAFEKTAGKNLDQFLSLADKIPDTGVPWLNTPIRAVNDRALGSADQAAFNAARDVALREIARVTNDPKLSGVLSDTARKEVSGLSAKDATFAQIKAVAKVLKQDMANVHAGITEQIDTVKTGLQGHPGAPPAASGSKPTAEELIKKYGGG